MKSDQWQVTSGKAPRFGVPRLRGPALRIPHSALRTRTAFTLIELLVVIAVIATLAALIVPTVGAVKKHQYISNAQAEMQQLETAIGNYKAAYGFYPPSTTNWPPYINQLYFELAGTIYNPTNTTYVTLDGSSYIPAANVPLTFPPMGGFINCTKSGSDEDSAKARNFLPGLKPNQVNSLTNINTGVQGINLLVTSVRGPDPSYRPLGLTDFNPWRYNSSHPTNNPSSYDLWVQLVIGGKTNLICNWNKSVQVNSPMP